MVLARPADSLGVSPQAPAGRGRGLCCFRGFSLEGEDCHLCRPACQPWWRSVDQAVHSEGFCCPLGSLYPKGQTLVLSREVNMRVGLRSLRGDSRAGCSSAGVSSLCQMECPHGTSMRGWSHPAPAAWPPLLCYILSEP